MIYTSCFGQCSLIQKWQKNTQWLGQRQHTLLTTDWHNFFATELKDKLHSTESFVVCFDELLNGVVQRGQMDLVIRYFDDRTNRVIANYLTSVFLGSATAVDLLSKFKEGIAGLPQNKLMQISMDGPSVNWSFLDKYEQDLTNEGIDEKILNIGSCGLHVIEPSKLDIRRVAGKLTVLLAMYRLFKDTPARRASFTAMTGCKTFPKKFCQIRWTTNASVADSALKLYDNCLCTSVLSTNMKRTSSTPCLQEGTVMKQTIV